MNFSTLQIFKCPLHNEGLAVGTNLDSNHWVSDFLEPNAVVPPPPDYYQQSNQFDTVEPSQMPSFATSMIPCQWLAAVFVVSDQFESAKDRLEQ